MKPRRPALPALTVALAVGLLAVAACSGSKERRFIPPPPVSIAKITTSPPGSDYTGVALAPVEGRVPVEKVEVLGGDSILGGVLLGPDGPVGGATVRLERFVGDAVGRLDVVSGPDGTWKAPSPPRPAAPPTFDTVPGQVTVPPTTPPPAVTKPTAGAQGILGGRYRVRAWRSPDLALTTPQILFVEAKQNKQLPLQLSRYTGTTVSAVSSPDPPVLEGPLNITAVVTTLTVDGEGVVRSAPAGGVTVTLNVGPGFDSTGGSAITNGAGRAAFQVRCVALGASQVELIVNEAETFTVPIRPCVLPAPVTTTTSEFFDDPDEPSTSSTAAATTTVRTTPGNGQTRP